MPGQLFTASERCSSTFLADFMLVAVGVSTAIVALIDGFKATSRRSCTLPEHDSHGPRTLQVAENRSQHVGFVLAPPFLSGSRRRWRHQFGRS